jgi:hypothetical protein
MWAATSKVRAHAYTRGPGEPALYRRLAALRGGAASECVNLLLMRRVQIIFVLIALVSSPLALVARSEACAEACTKSCCVARHHSSHDTGPAAGHCHGNRQAPSARCCDEPVSNHALDYGFTILMPLSILPDVPEIEAPAISGAAVVSSPLVVPSAFGSAPFEPPRA